MWWVVGVDGQGGRADRQAAGDVCGAGECGRTAFLVPPGAPAQESRVTTEGCSGRSAGVGRVVPGREAAAEP